MGVIANYVFDGLPHDLFEIRNGQLRTRHIRCKLDPVADDISDIAKTATIDYQDTDCAKNYYRHTGWNALLDKYRTEEKNLNFAVPVGGLTAIEKMSSLTTGPMFMIASDFGDSDMSAIRSLPKRHVATNGCYSVRVNFHAVSKYLEQIGGNFYAPEHSKSSLETVGLVTNLGKSKYKSLTHAFQSHIRNFGPDEFFMLKKVVERNFDSHNFQNIIGLLRISHWDAKFFCGCAPALKESLETLDLWQKKAVVQVLCNVDDTYFRCDNTVDPSILIIDMLLALGEHNCAQEMFCKNEKFLRQTATGKIEADRLRAAIN
ncbi:MAG: hypothetical protein V7723_16935 [Sneathiella sp.]|uniref:hypothetical protein n=1 Tax=Sneathiella sp. TaxID=1964365 RepID=UPI003002672C